MPAWTIKSKLRNLLDPGSYEFRLESVSYKKPGENKEYGSILFTWVNVEGGEDGVKQFQSFPLNPEYLGLLGQALAGTNGFDENEELPDDGEALSRVLDSRLSGKVYDIKYAHRLDKKTQQTWPNIEIAGPTQSAFR